MTDHEPITGNIKINEDVSLQSIDASDGYNWLGFWLIGICCTRDNQRRRIYRCH